jgi:hypothetical protein
VVEVRESARARGREREREVTIHNGLVEEEEECVGCVGDDRRQTACHSPSLN